PAHFELMRRAPVRSERHLRADGLANGRMRVTEQQGPMPTEVVDVLPAVHVPLARTGAARGIEGIGEERAAVVGEPGGDHLERARPERRRLRRACPVLPLDMRVRPPHGHAITPSPAAKAPAAAIVERTHAPGQWAEAGAARGGSGLARNASRAP